MAEDDLAKKNADFLNMIERAWAEKDRKKEQKNFLAKKKYDDAEFQKQFTQQTFSSPFVDNSPNSIYQEFSDKNHDFSAAAEARYSSSYDPHSGQKPDVRLNRGLGCDPIRKVHMNESVNHRKYDGNAVRVHVKLQSGVGSNNNNNNSNSGGSSVGGGVKLNRGW